MKRREKAKATKTGFCKTRAFIGDRIRMCRIKKVGMRQHYYSAKAKLERKLEKPHSHTNTSLVTPVVVSQNFETRQLVSPKKCYFTKTASGCVRDD